MKIFKIQFDFFIQGQSHLHIQEEIFQSGLNGWVLRSERQY